MPARRWRAEIELPQIDTIARLVAERHTLGVAAIPSIAEEVRAKYPMVEITVHDLEQAISEFLEAPQI